MKLYDPPTNEQRGLYWIWIKNAANQLDMKPDDLHQAFKRMLIDGRSTQGLHKIQFNQYMDQVSRFCQENEIMLPKSIIKLNNAIQEKSQSSRSCS